MGQAYQMMQQGGYQNTKEDLTRVLESKGISKAELAFNLQRLDNSFLGNALNKFSPNLTSQLKALGQEICAESSVPGNSPQVTSGVKILPLKGKK